MTFLHPWLSDPVVAFANVDLLEISSLCLKIGKIHEFLFIFYLNVLYSPRAFGESVDHSSVVDFKTSDSLSLVC